MIYSQLSLADDVMEWEDKGKEMKKSKCVLEPKGAWRVKGERKKMMKSSEVDKLGG